MNKSKIYTFTGDTGTTGLVSGTRVSKSDDRISLYGEVEELNSHIGLVISFMRKENDDAREINFLEEIQASLFDLGSNLAIESEKRADWKLPTISAERVKQLEAEIDWMDAGLAPLKNFILPGGTIVASSIHLCRTSARTVERKMVGFTQDTGEEMPEHSLKFVNRLSDYFFVLARSVNKQMGQSETTWKATN